MADITYTLDKEVAVVSLNTGENRFNLDFVDTFISVFDELETKTEARTIVVTSSHEKIFSNGIDLDWLSGLIQAGKADEVKQFLYRQNDMFKRVATCPMITIAAISGHAFAGGAILACAFDFRVMRSDRGFFCFPEVDLGIPFLPGMLALLESAIPLYKMNEMQYLGLRMTAEECEKHHIVTRACHKDDLMNEAMAFAKKFNKDRKTIGEMKRRMNRNIVAAMDNEDGAYIERGRLV
ncbi:enoyl-CoA hydratase/isomerase family protein [Desulfosudis oleivorans]|uniref:Enoyl-CoA hydratase/isomerase n=1 Tax=Desulfosudis oleivorans (strain DSM 6200 / JCM 39069 / Hxd3) TaxID=96561 RepID=A8ZUR2_DESOH|nr:enoyl-CoA hydratase/isomerase family protein [Desulfosudis oleivorans]ABW66475.1 Enoyl-CoA hydratase/isomerase [Desulfosudis oleivorans Hxd3]